MKAGNNTEKICVTLPRELAGEIKANIAQGQVSAFFVEALQYYLALRKQKISMEKGFGAWSDENHLDLVTPSDSTAYVNVIREADAGRLNVRRDNLAS